MSNLRPAARVFGLGQRDQGKTGLKGLYREKKHRAVEPVGSWCSFSWIITWFLKRGVGFGAGGRIGCFLQVTYR